MRPQRSPIKSLYGGNYRDLFPVLFTFLGTFLRFGRTNTPLANVDITNPNVFSFPTVEACGQHRALAFFCQSPLASLENETPEEPN